MMLYKSTVSTSQWLSGVLHAFFRKQPVTTTAVIVTSVLSRITKLLAFLLPLKVILLAGSSGVPRYFPFIDPNYKMDWIIWLTAAAFVSYGLKLVMDALAKRLSESGSAEVLQEANELTVIKNQVEEGRIYYMMICQVCASLMFILIGISVLLWLNIKLAGVLAGLMLSQYMFTAWAMNGSDNVDPGKLRRFIQESTGNYLSILVSLNFLLGFLVILAPFMSEGATGNILVAILSFVITRQILGNSASIIKYTTSMASEYHKVNALVFRDYQLEKMLGKLDRTFKDLFHKSVRQVSVHRELEQSGRRRDDVDVQWTDSAIKGVYIFNISTENMEGREHELYQLQVTSPRIIHQVEYEDFLFRSISRGRLKAPELLSCYKEGPFECRIYDHGSGAMVSDQEWRNAYFGLLEHYWSCQPPKSLITSYTASHLLLDSRLNSELLERLGVAVDRESEARTLSALQSQISHIRDRVASMPLYVNNLYADRYNVVRYDTDDYRMMYWGRWTLEPIGAVLPRALNLDRLNDMLGNASKSRSDCHAPIAIDHLLLVSLCKQFVDKIDRERYKSALRVGEHILKKLSTPDMGHAGAEGRRSLR